MTTPCLRRPVNCREYRCFCNDFPRESTKKGSIIGIDSASVRHSHGCDYDAHVNYNRGQKYGYILYSPYHHGHAVWLYLINKKASFYQKKSGRSSKATIRKIKSPQKVCICFVLRFERNEPTPTGRPQSYLRVGWRKVFFQDDCGARLASKEEIA